MRNDVRILIVEDSMTQMIRLRHILEMQGYQVSSAKNGLEALQCLDEQRITLVITDVVMPKMGGFELCRKIKDTENLHDIPVIILTSLSDPEDVIRGLHNGADHFIMKPYEDHFLLSRIEYVLANMEIRRHAGAEMGVEIFFGGKKQFLAANRMQILDLLLSTYENAVQKQHELERTNKELKIALETIEASEDSLRRQSSILEAVSFIAEKLFRTLSPPDILPEILERLGQATGISRIWIFQYHSTEQAKNPDDLYFQWTAPGIPDRKEAQSSDFPCTLADIRVWREILESGRPVYGKTETFPGEMQQILSASGIQVIMLVPVFVSASLWGLIGLEEYGKERAWTAPEIDALKAAANNIGAAIQRRETERELRYAKEKSEQASRSKSEFLANMSHEIRTPMNAILGFSEILSGLITDPVHKEYLSTICSSGRTLLSLINDILDLSKVEAGKMELEYSPLDIRTLLGEIRQMFSQKVAAKGLELTVETEENLPDAIVSDEARLRQIVINLVGNAVKFTEKGHIKIRVSADGADDNGRIRELRISVEDTGIGIAYDDRESIFNAFEQQRGQSHARYGGTGLGLAITKRLTEMMGGRISVDSEVGKGSTFHLVFRDVEVGFAPTQLEEDNFYADDIVFDHPGTVLVVDDIDLNRRLVREYLQPYGFGIAEAENGAEGIAKAKAVQPDVIVMDLRMPVMNGDQAADIIRKDPDLSHIPIIMATASGMKHTEDRMKSMGYRFLAKPVRKADLVRELTCCLPCSLKKMQLPVSSPEQTYEKIQQDIPEVKEPDPAVAAKFPELRQIMVHNFLPKWEKLCQEYCINDIDAWAGKIRDLAQSYEYAPLMEWSRRMLLQTGMFDMENMSVTLDEFPDILRQMPGASG